MSMEHKNDTTIQTLYRIAKEQMAEENLEKPIASALADVCNQTNTQFQKLVYAIEAMPDRCVKRGEKMTSIFSFFVILQFE